MKGWKIGRFPKLIGLLAWVMFGACLEGCSEPASAIDATIEAGIPTLTAEPKSFVGSGGAVVFLDLIKAAERAHIRREGPWIAPDSPGWARVTRLADRTPWLPPKIVADHPVSWLDSIGGTLFFPVGAEGPSLRKVQIRLRPIAARQVVSVFLDEKPLTTMRLKKKEHTYTLSLPEAGLTPGEHSLRFWFRFRRRKTKRKNSLRTPGALVSARFLTHDAPSPLPLTWTDTFSVADIGGPSLMAGPPAGWRFFLLPPEGGRFTAHAAVESGEPVNFIVRITSDNAKISERIRIEVTAGSVAKIDVDLTPYANQPIRLSLDTEGASGDLARAGWINPKIFMPGPPEARAPTVRNVVILTVDGLRADRVGLGRGGDRAATPNLDLLALEGGAAVDVWAGGARAEDGHRRLLKPAPEIQSLPALMAIAGRRPGFFSTSRSVPDGLADDFSTHFDTVRAGEAAITKSLLIEVGDWLDVRKKTPFFLYIASADPRVPLEPPEGYTNLYRRARPLMNLAVRNAVRDQRDLLASYDASVSATDYWLGQLIALLKMHAMLDNTAIIVVGTVGQDLHDVSGLGDGHVLAPELLQVPAVIWHPGLRRQGHPRALLRGGDLADVAATALALVGGELPSAWPGTDLSAALFGGLPLPPQPSHASLKNQVAARYGDWLLRGAGTRDLRLWNLLEDPAARDEIRTGRPIALRTLRDSMQDRP